MSVGQRERSPYAYRMAALSAHIPSHLYALEGFLTYLGISGLKILVHRGSPVRDVMDQI